ncbi:hypothetical protein BT96DRAFT_919038, partial [Gymnopus androsaceus JB14]
MASVSLAQTIPPELKRYIAVFCNPAALGNLALVHTSYRDEAEVLLYRQISVYFSPKKLSIWDTLKTHPRKAYLVRRWDSQNKSAPTSAVELLCAALANMHQLVDLQLHLYREEVTLQTHIQAILSQRYFNLETFHCSGHFDISAIADAQSNSLQTLATYNHRNTMSSFRDMARKYPNLTLFSYERETFIASVFDVLNIYPAFYPENTFRKCWEAISKSYHCRGEFESFSRVSVGWVRVYLADISEFDSESNLRFIRHDIVEEMSFYKHIPPIIAPLALKLRELRFAYWGPETPHDDGSAIPLEDCLALAKTWYILTQYIRIRIDGTVFRVIMRLHRDSIYMIKSIFKT